MSVKEMPAPTIVAPEITVDVLQQAASKLGVRVPANVEDDFAEQMRSAREAILEVVAMEGMYLGAVKEFVQTDTRSLDFIPPPETEKYPRTDLLRPAPDDNPYNAWATKATLKGAEEGILSGKTLVLKVRHLTTSLDGLQLTMLPG